MNPESERGGQAESTGAMTPVNGKDPVRRWFSRVGEKRGLNRATQARYLTILEQFTKFIDKSPEALVSEAKSDAETTRDSIDEFVQSLRDQGRKPGTLRTAVACLRSFFKANGVLVLVGAPGGETVRASRPLTEDELGKILSLADARERAVIFLMAHGGLRSGAVIRLKVGDIDFSTTPITVKAFDEKGDKYYETYISPEAGGAVRSYLDLRRAGTRKIDPEIIEKSSPVIRAVTKARPLKVGTVDPRQINRSFLRLFAAAGINHNVSSHSLRKYHYNRLVNSRLCPESHANLLQGRAAERGAGRAYNMPSPETLAAEYMAVFMSEAKATKEASDKVAQLEQRIEELTRALWVQSGQVAELKSAAFRYDPVGETERARREFTTAKKAPPPK